MRNNVETFIGTVKEKAARPLLVVGLGVGSVMMAGCAQGDKPLRSTDRIETSNFQIFENTDVLDGNGDPLKCIVNKGSGSNHFYQGWAWESMTCDFTGDAIFPGESKDQASK